MTVKYPQPNGQIVLGGAWSDPLPEWEAFGCNAGTDCHVAWVHITDIAFPATTVPSQNIKRG